MKSISEIPPKWRKIMLMKHRLLKYMIVAAFFAAVMPIEAKGQYAQAAESPQTLNNEIEKTPFEESASPFKAPPPAYAPPPGGDDGQKIIPVSDTSWVLMGLVVAYGFVRRRNLQKEIKTLHN